MNTLFTKSEQEDAKYSVGEAVAAARRRLPKGVSINVTGIPPYTDKITLKKLNEVADKIVYQTLEYL